MDRHQFSEALGKFQTACVMNPGSDAGCLNMGIAFLNMLRYDDAAKTLARVTPTAIRRTQKGIWFNLEALLGKGFRPPGLEPAREDFQKVAALDPNDADTQYFLGYIASEEQQVRPELLPPSGAPLRDRPVPCLGGARHLAEADRHAGDLNGAKRRTLERFHASPAERLGKPVALSLRRAGQILAGWGDGDAAGTRAGGDSRPLR